MELIEVNFRKVRRPRPHISDEDVQPQWGLHEEKVFRTKKIVVERKPFKFEGSNEIPPAPEMSDSLKRFIYDSLGVAVRGQESKVDSPKGEDAV